ncbi:MAG: recombinase family protein [Bacillota bacterium]
MSLSFEKIQPQHLSRLAVVYIRQSTLAQVRFHSESTERQYALRDKALRLGWSAEQIQVIDEDLGLSGAQKSNRHGFQRLVSQVSLGQVGAIFGLEVSRLARSSADWLRLLELCSLFETVIVDEDGIYDLGDFNDRLVLGLKGTMSEAELHFLRGRLLGGKKNKAQKGELRFPLPVGFCYDDLGHTVIDPDQEVQAAVGNVFSAFKATGSAYGVVQSFAQNGFRFPKRAYGGAWAGKLIWGTLTHGRVLSILSNPSYAGAYVFGRFKSRKKISSDGVLGYQTVRLPQDQWEVLISDHHSGYISWAQYEENLKQLQLNRTNAELSGPAREGAALFQGLILCGRCGLRMTVRYTGNGGISPRYECRRQIKDGKMVTCSSIKCETVDQAMVGKIMEALQPAQLELALKALDEVQKQADEIEMNWRLKIERAQYEAERAERQFNLVDPENRLVARTLETRWNDKLAALKCITDDLDLYRKTRSSLPSPAAQQEILALAGNIPSLWQAKSTANKDKKRLIRLLVEDITVTSFPQQPEATIGIRWRSGCCETIGITKDLPVSLKRKHTQDTVKLVKNLSKDMTDSQIVQYLNDNGFRTSEGLLFTVSGVRWIRFRYHIPGPSGQSLSVADVAEYFGVSPGIVYYWLERGILKGSKRAPGWPWEIIIDDSTEKTLAERVQRSKRVTKLDPESCLKEGAV